MYTVVLMAALSTEAASPDSCFTDFCNRCGQPTYAESYAGFSQGITPFGGGCAPSGEGFVRRYAPYGGYGRPYFGGSYDRYGVTGSYVGTCGCFGGRFIGSYGEPPVARSGFGDSGYYPGIGYGGVRNEGSYSGSFAPVAPVLPGKGLDGKVESKVGGNQSQAKVIIDVPAQASLYIDGELMPARSGKRTFFTPALEPNQTYFIDVKVALVQDGKEQVQATRVVLRAGEEVAANFNALTNSIVTVSVNPRP